LHHVRVIVVKVSSRIAATLIAAVVGGVVASVALIAAYGLTSGLRIEMDRDLPSTVRGFFPIERGAGKTFAWSRRTAEASWPGLDRRGPWTCTIDMLGSRPPTAPLPTVRFSADGVEVYAWTSRGGDEQARFEIPAKPEGSGLVLALSVSEMFRPADDPRDLGIAVDRIACDPAAGRMAIVPSGALWRAAAAGALFGAAFGLLGLSTLLATAGALLVGAAQAAPLAIGMAPFVAPESLHLAIALGLALTLGAFALLKGLARRAPLSVPTQTAVALSAALCYLKLLVLLHPGMPPMDSVFQAHRLEWVLSGRYYFTSLTPDGYQFPYGISLYLAAAPFASLLRDHVALLRIVVCVAEMLAGLSLFAIINRTWRDGLTGLLAVVLFHTTPIAAAVVGTGNLTNAFGESMALLSVATIVALPVTWPVWAWLTVPMLVASVAFIAHFSTFMVLALTICAIGLVYYLFGGPTLERAASCVLMTLGLAVLMSVVAFYGHFWGTYREQAGRLAGDVKTIVSSERQQAGQAPHATPPEAPAMSLRAAPSTPSGARRLRPSVSVRFATLGRRMWSAYSWPLPVVALIGLAVLIRRRERDRLSLAVAGWLVTLAGCAALAVFSPLELRYQLAIAPALAVLGGLAAAAGWRTGGWRRWAMVALLTVIVVVGTRNWFDWVL
jgi:hypothetical protein